MFLIKLTIAMTVTVTILCSCPEVRHISPIGRSVPKRSTPKMSPTATGRRDRRVSWKGTLWLCQNSYGKWDSMGFNGIYDGIASGKLTVCYGKWPSRNSEFSHEKHGDFPVRFLYVYQRVMKGNSPKIAHPFQVSEILSDPGPDGLFSCFFMICPARKYQHLHLVRWFSIQLRLTARGY